MSWSGVAALDLDVAAEVGFEATYAAAQLEEEAEQARADRRRGGARGSSRGGGRHRLGRPAERPRLDAQVRLLAATAGKRIDATSFGSERWSSTSGDP